MTIKLALAQLRSSLYEKEINLHRAVKTITASSQKGANYILFPELYISGYFLNEEKVCTLSEPMDGPTIQTLKKAANEHNINVIIGFPEKKGSSIYNSAAFINNEGNLLGVYRKVHLYDHEQRIFTPGNSCPVFDLPEGRIGIMITYDMEFPETARILALKGCQALLILAANMVPYQAYQSAYIQTRAMENQVFVAATNMVGLEFDVIFFGESEVVHPTGKILYKSCNDEDLAIVELKLEETARSKGVLNYLANRRPDLYAREGL